jgi:hypothetical protein
VLACDCKWFHTPHLMDQQPLPTHVLRLIWKFLMRGMSHHGDVVNKCWSINSWDLSEN